MPIEGITHVADAETAVVAARIAMNEDRGDGSFESLAPICVEYDPERKE